MNTMERGSCKYLVGIKTFYPCQVRKDDVPKEMKYWKVEIL